MTSTPVTAWPRTTATARTIPDSPSASSTITTPAPGAGCRTCATVPTVRSREYDNSKHYHPLFSGNTFKPENVVNNAVDKFGIPNCGRNQGRPQEPEFCTCEDGSTFELVAVQIVQVNHFRSHYCHLTSSIQSGGQPSQSQRCGGGLPRSCTCPGGREITR